MLLFNCFLLQDLPKNLCSLSFFIFRFCLLSQIIMRWRLFQLRLRIIGCRIICASYFSRRVIRHTRITFVGLLRLLLNAVRFQLRTLIGRRLQIKFTAMSHLYLHIFQSLLLLNRLAFLSPKGCCWDAASSTGTPSRRFIFLRIVHHRFLLHWLQVAVYLLSEDATVRVIAQVLFHLLYFHHIRPR